MAALELGSTGTACGAKSAYTTVVGTGVLGWVSFWSEQRGLKELVGPGLRSWVKVLAGASRDRPEVQVGPTRLRLGKGSGIGFRSLRALLEPSFTEVKLGLVRKEGIRGLKVLTEGLPNPSPLGSGHLRLLLLGLDVLGLGLCRHNLI